ncbi:hypothetical protein ABTZ21_08140 [Streptomyces sp. NPDC096191]|uniref:hypothetical protein n=1 Tax=Streptomyces sp. NPDC096191 TaxID=3155426 RepID=UPI003320807E
MPCRPAVFAAARPHRLREHRSRTRSEPVACVPVPGSRLQLRLPLPHLRVEAGEDPGARAAQLEAADTFQAAVAEHPAAEGKPRVDVETAAKKVVRHPEPAG